MVRKGYDSPWDLAKGVAKGADTALLARVHAVHFVLLATGAASAGRVLHIFLDVIGYRARASLAASTHWFTAAAA